MAAARPKPPPVGSSEWTRSEKEHASQLVDQEVDEFGFSVRNDLEWLNEHMADIFSKSQVKFADMFKTPGKLRGKTPRTARKLNDPTSTRQPLTDVFAPNATPAPVTAVRPAFVNKIAQFQIAEDTENQAPSLKPSCRGGSPQRAGTQYTDSGYHGMMTEDEAELDVLSQTQPFTQPEDIDILADVEKSKTIPLREDQPPPQRLRDGKADDSGASDDSFVSAREEETRDSGHVAVGDPEVTDGAGPKAVSDIAHKENVIDANHSLHEDMIIDPVPKASVAEHDLDVDMDMEAGTPQSDGSSPDKPFARKSSFTFASLPAREPLGAKKSMGQMDRQRSSFFGKSVNRNHTDPEDDSEEKLAQERLLENKLHNKSSTQLLHERLNMLGKVKEPRSSKSIPQSVLSGQILYPQLPETKPANPQSVEPPESNERAEIVAHKVDDDEEWIAPTKPAQPVPATTETQETEATQPSSSVRPVMHQKSMSTTVMPSPAPAEMGGEFRHQKAISVSHPNLADALGSTTPAGSPKRQNDGPLSASKNRLWSALKSAKSIFASSASTSAAAKLEAYNSQVPRSPPKPDLTDNKMFNMPGALYSQKTLLQSPSRNASVISFSPSRKTRNSAESDKKKEKELKAQQKAANELEKAREHERQKAAKQQAEERAKAEKAEATRLEKERKQAEKQKANAPAERPESAGSGKVSVNDAPPPPPPKNNVLPTGKLRAPGRIMRPTREPAQAKPAPVSIRVASQSQRAGPVVPSSAFSKSQHEVSAPQVPAKDGSRASSALSTRPGSTQPGNARLKALEAAARKKEADERAAQKKADQKKELERKRAEKAEQEKRQEEERKAAEYQRMQETKLAIQRKAAEKQAIEARKREQERIEQQRREQEQLDQRRREQERAEQQRLEAEQVRLEEEARKAREAQELADSIRRERAQQMHNQRSDVPGTLRQLTKNTIPSNQAKPAKRQFAADDDAPVQQPQRPGIIRGPPSYQQADAKRRRTNEEHEEPNPRNSVMAPPKRPSTLRKASQTSLRRHETYANHLQETMSKFSGYTHAPPPAAHHSSMFKATVTAQHQIQHNSRPVHPSQLVQTSNARIPFAENPNPSAPYSGPSSQMHSSYESAHSNKFKTPARPATTTKSAKSTPHYPQGDNIELPDIATDSEDESDDGGDTGFRAPSWVASPALRDLLTQQQLVDPETVFGPIGELKMDEVFKNTKNQDRLKRFRDRGSSALWTETGDAVTSAEKRKDMEMRERVAREGGWRYEPAA